MSIKEIVVVPYNPEWPKLFEHEAERIKEALGDDCIAIHHVGSTSVPGLAAKPIIDCIVVVKKGEASIQPLKTLGYRYCGQLNIPFRLFFNTPNAHLHVYEEGHPEIARNLFFREHLRSHPETRDAYATLKHQILTDPTAHIKTYSPFAGYTLSKEPFIRTIMEKNPLQELRIVQSIHHNEWNAVRNLRNTYFFDPQGIKDPYDWTFESPFHKHLVLYKGEHIIGYVHIQLWEEKRAAVRIIVIDKSERNKQYGSQLLRLCEKWLKILEYKSLHVEANPKALEFYKKQDYVEMPFNDPDEYESSPQDRAVGKIL